MPLIAQMLAQSGMDPLGSVAAQWVSVIVQGGAIAILGYHLLIGLPKMLRDNAEDQHKMVIGLMEMFKQTLGEDRRIASERSSDDRKAFADRTALVVQELGLLRDALPSDLVPKVEELLVELKKQTMAMDRQTSEIRHQSEATNKMADKIAEWPSDLEKLCKAEQVLKQAGFDLKAIERVLKHKRGQS